METELQTVNLWDPSGKPTLKAAAKGLLHISLFAVSYENCSNQALEDNIHARDALVWLFIIFDRRVGSKRLLALGNEMISEAAWLSPFMFRVKCEREFTKL